MYIDISSIAFAVRTSSAASNCPIKLSHAQQCVAAALGYRSFASFQQAGEYNLSLAPDSSIVFDTVMLERRANELAIECGPEELLSHMRNAFTEKVRGIGTYDSIEDFEKAVQRSVDRYVLNHEKTVSQTAMVNSDGIGEIYLPLEVDWLSLPIDSSGITIPINGHVSMNIDEDRPYAGHRTDVSAALWVARRGRAVYTVGLEVYSATLDQSGGEEAPQFHEGGLLTDALIDLLDIDLESVEFLEDARLEAVEGVGGKIDGYLIDFSAHGLAKSEQAQMIKKHGSLIIRVPANFFDKVFEFKGVQERHYVHGDQKEGEVGSYYCRRCRSFYDGEHFEAEHPGEAEENYFNHLAFWKSRHVGWKLNYCRPDNAPNVLAASAIAQRNSRETARSEFHRWLLTLVDRNDPIGDLARDVRGDRRFPSSETSHDKIRGYVKYRALASEVVDAFDDAWREYCTSKGDSRQS